MSYRPKKVFVKTENGAYTVITFQEFKKLRETDEAFATRKFVKVYYDTLVEFDRNGVKKYRSFMRHLKHLKENDSEYNLTSYGCIYKDDREVIDPVEQVEENELNRKLHDCIDKLKPIEQIIVMGLFFDELSEEEVAEVVGLSQSSVSRRKKTILKKLKKFLKE